MDLRAKVKSLAIEIALEESLSSGRKYGECIGESLQKACLKLGVSKKEFIKMFI